MSNRFGKSKSQQREERAEWLENAALENAAAIEKAAAAGLPALTGSEKQIGWACTIRQSALDQIERIIAVIERGDDKWKGLFRVAGFRIERMEPGQTAPPAIPEPYLRCLIAEQVRLRAVTSAKWWIDNRDRLNADSACDRANKRILAECAGKDYEELMRTSFFAVTTPDGGVL